MSGRSRLEARGAVYDPWDAERDTFEAKWESFVAALLHWRREVWDHGI